MPTFRVQFEQWAQEVATAEIEADTAEEAIQIAREGSEEFSAEMDLDWEDGSDIQDTAIIGVLDEHNTPAMILTAPIVIGAGDF